MKLCIKFMIMCIAQKSPKNRNTNDKVTFFLTFYYNHRGIGTSSLKLIFLQMQQSILKRI